MTSLDGSNKPISMDKNPYPNKEINFSCKISMKNLEKSMQYQIKNKLTFISKF